MHFTDGELIDINARAVQMFVDYMEFDGAETLEDYKEAVKRLYAKAIKQASITLNVL